MLPSMVTERTLERCFVGDKEELEEPERQKAKAGRDANAGRK
jgi:hypothetical protein